MSKLIYHDGYKLVTVSKKLAVNIPGFEKFDLNAMKGILSKTFTRETTIFPLYIMK